VLGDTQSRYLYALLVWVALATLLGLAVATSPLALLGMLCLLPAGSATRRVLTGTAGRGLVPVLQQTGLAELLYALGIFVGLLLAG